MAIFNSYFDITRGYLHVSVGFPPSAETQPGGEEEALVVQAPGHRIGFLSSGNPPGASHGNGDGDG